MSFKREESLATLCHRKGRLSRDFNYASTTQLCPRKRPFSISNYDSFDPFLICREIFRLVGPLGSCQEGVLVHMISDTQPSVVEISNAGVPRGECGSQAPDEAARCCRYAPSGEAGS